MSKLRKFLWQKSLLGAFVVCTAYTPLDGGETFRIKWQDGLLYRSSDYGWTNIASVDLPVKNVAEFTGLERDLLSSVVRDLGYTPGNIDNL